ncbi:MAG: aconitate hydratase AcnA [Hyphomicrobiales bacterium]|nr:MAG: aconitate hydratase AcnA [Hyphomicrobiales bacterium]
MTTPLTSLDSFNCRRELKVGDKSYIYFDLKEAEKNGLTGISRMPNSLKVVLENLLRFEDDRSVTKDDILAVAKWMDNAHSDAEIAYRPARVLMQDFTGVPAVVDLATMRAAMEKIGEDPKKINPQVPVDLVIDHSVMVDNFGTPTAFEQNVEIEYVRNKERYEFLRWGATAFDNFRVVPPGTGICHQVNLEYLAQTVWTRSQTLDGKEVEVAYPDTLVGTDSHTTMVNGMAVLGWGVGGIEAESSMLGQPISMLVPDVVGFELTGKMPEGTTATDMVLTIVEMLRGLGVVGKFVEFYGEGLDDLTLEDQATIANMAPEYGATCGFFPIDADTLKFLNHTGRDEDRIALVEAYSKAQGMFRDENSVAPKFTDTLHLDLSEVVPCISGPKRPQDRIKLDVAASTFEKIMGSEFNLAGQHNKRVALDGKDHDLGNGDIVVGAITSCTNTSNPSVLIAAGLVAKKCNELGIKPKPWVKTSLAPGSQVVTDYLEAAGLQSELDNVGFNLVGYGCTTCIGNSGPIDPVFSKAIEDHDLVACSVLSGNRNFEGRISPDVRANFLASPPLVVAYSIAGNMNVDITKGVLAVDKDGNDVYLKDIWPTNQEIAEIVAKCITREMFVKRYADVFKGDEHWQAIEVDGGLTYNWNSSSTYIQHPPYFEGMGAEPTPLPGIEGARVMALLGDSVTTDHISPAGQFKPEHPAGQYLVDRQVSPKDFNSYGSRRGNHEVMMRGTFANIRIKNAMIPGSEGGVTRHYPSGEDMWIYDAAEKYKADGVPLVIFGGKEYGTGSSRDWAAKGTNLLGVRAVITESFERIHRSNLVGMGVLPLQFKDGTSWKSLGLKGDEIVSINGIDNLSPRCDLEMVITMGNGDVKKMPVLCRIDTLDELDYVQNGGILQYVLRDLAK